MGLMEKIEDIRKKPEHIRRRYVFFCVCVSAIFILMIWFFSFGNNDIKQVNNIDPSGDLSNIANQFDAQKQSMQATVDNVKSAMNQDAANKMQDNGTK
jgi:hypothetical protein